MPQTYDFVLKPGTDVSALIARVRGEAAKRHIAFTGDERSGRFEGPAAGSYAVEAGTVRVTVDSKPSLIPWGMVESALRGLFEA